MRLEAMRATDERQAFEFAELIVDEEDIEEDLLDEILDAEILEDADGPESEPVDVHKLKEEITTLRSFRLGQIHFSRYQNKGFTHGFRCRV